MSTRGWREPPLKSYMRNSRRRRTVLDVDLNAPPSENQEGTSAHADSHDALTGQQEVLVPSAAVGFDSFDDDVIISSPRAFAEAKNNARRNNGRTVVVDIDSEERISRSTSNSVNKRRRILPGQTIVDCELLINLEGSNQSTRDAVQIMGSPSPLPPPPPPQEKPTFNCPVCMGPLVEETSTKCGHIFCKACIRAAIVAQSKCPTCRRKVTVRDTIRIYLPAAS